MTKKESARRAPTESDVAKLAGVSQSAVSRAFTPGASVAEATRKKILLAAQSLGYQPNLMARSLATRRSNIVALAISYLENPFYAQVVKELSDRLRDTGRHILLFTTPPNQDADPALERVLSYQVDALVMTATTASLELALQCQKAGVPIVQINRESKLPGISTVRGENQRAGEMVAAFLEAGGHKQFAFLGGTETSSTGRTRRDAFTNYLKARGHEVEVAFGNYTFEGAAAAARKLLEGPTPPDAIFCASDYMAFAVSDVARREYKLRVPQDLSIVGFDDVPEAAHSGYDLTTFSQPAAALVEEAIKIVDTMIAEPGRRAQRREVRGQLIVRGSARLPSTGIIEADGKKIWQQ
ncbi:LacI family DNA-binding transcriptional regulator [Mariluticola halotolerans]|uniref:LacI family DNA-binding transcriptional regulator n=1 Tax=Mariluticola halotolerans TaxID=2909283 RepID=UPI0026E1BAB6|nr:LacI family DNA-binding transcriptional regulator [Mariluticola halotolerans]UJQ95557.1 LacI family DNA-binding transcriptional regulator [Mariluticola halotolerans]